MQIRKLSINNFRGIKHADLEFDGHTLLVGGNNVGKSTIFEALELALGAERHKRFPVVDEYDFYNGEYLNDDETPIEIRIDVVLIDITEKIALLCANYVEFWHTEKQVLLSEGDILQTDVETVKKALRLTVIVKYREEEDEFRALTYYTGFYDPDNEDEGKVSRGLRQALNFLYLRTLRTGSRALSLERGSLLDAVLRIKSIKTGIWERARSKLKNMNPPIDHGDTTLTPVLKEIEERISNYITLESEGSSTRLFVSNLTREHLRRTLSLFLTVSRDQEPVPFQEVGTGTLNVLVLALLSIVAELKEEGVIFAMEEPEIAVPPHTQRRIVGYLLSNTSQCFVTSHSPYVIENFQPENIRIIRRGVSGLITSSSVVLNENIKKKSYRRHLRRSFAEAMLANAVIIVEGYTEVVVLQAVSSILESSDKNLYPLDLAGVSIVTSDGDGAIAEFGKFFTSLDIRAYALYDESKRRSEKQKQEIGNAGFCNDGAIRYSGIEKLLVTEIPLACQRDFLRNYYSERNECNGKIHEVEHLEDDVVVKDVRGILKDGKGAGVAADLIALCKPEELPKTITELLHNIYQHFQRPVAGLESDQAVFPTPAAYPPTLPDTEE